MIRVKNPWHSPMSIVAALSIALAFLASGCMSGVVIDENTGKPVSGATVTYTDSGGRTASTTTDANGFYAFPFPAAPLPGPITIEVSAPGYPQQTMSRTVSYTSNPNASFDNILSFWDNQNLILSKSGGGQPQPTADLALTKVFVHPPPPNTQSRVHVEIQNNGPDNLTNVPVTSQCQQCYTTGTCVSPPTQTTHNVTLANGAKAAFATDLWIDTTGAYGKVECTISAPVNSDPLGNNNNCWGACAPPPHPGGCTPPPTAAGEATLCQDTQYCGGCMTFTKSTSLPVPYFGDNTASSIVVGPGTTVQLCDLPNFGGTCETFTANDPDLSNNLIGDNTTSSINFLTPAGCTPPPAPPAGAVTLCRDTQYCGACQTFTSPGSAPNLAGSTIGDNQASSIMVGPGTTVDLCDLPNFGGTCERFTANDPELSNNPIGDNTTSSVGFPRPNADLALIEVFVHPKPPDKHSEVYVRIQNNGPDNLYGIPVRVVCSPPSKEMWLNVTLQVGQKQAYDTYFQIDTTVANLMVKCSIDGHVNNDPTANNKGCWGHC